MSFSKSSLNSSLALSPSSVLLISWENGKKTNSIMESVLTRTSWNTNAPLGSVSGCTGHRKHRVYMRLKWKSCLPQIASVNYIHRTKDNFPCTQGPSSSLCSLLRGLDKEQWSNKISSKAPVLQEFTVYL